MEERMDLFFRAIISLIVCVSVISAQQVSNFSTKGSTWLGGGMSYASIGYEGGDSRMNMLQLSPVLRFFPADHFMIGPNVSWTGMFADGESVNQFGLGLEIGGAFNNGGTVIPYVRSGGSVAIFGGSGMSSETGFSLPLAAGMIIPIGGVLALQIEPAYTITWVNESSMNVFSLSFGICGIGEKTAVSVMQGMSGLTSFF